MIKARFCTKYPKRIQVTDGLTKTEANGVITLGFDYESTEIGAELEQAVSTATDSAASASSDAAAAAASAAAAADSAASSANSTCPTVDDLRGITPISGKAVNVLGYYAEHDGGGFQVVGVTGASAGTFSDNGGSIIVPTGGDGSKAWLSQYPLLRALQWGLKGDGETDDSARAQVFIDENKGRRIFFDTGHQFLAGGIILNGVSYDRTELIFNGELLMTARSGASDKNFQSNVYVGIAVQAVDSARIEGYINGNLENQYEVQQTFCLCLAGATNFKSDFLCLREFMGDGVYLTTEQVVSDSANCDTITFGTIIAHNSTDAGRNAVSVISGDNVSIGHLKSTGVGSFINGDRMPGGFDAECDTDYHSIRNLQIGSAHITTAGSVGFGLYGRPSINNVDGVSVGPVIVVNTAPASLNDENGNATCTDCMVLSVQNALNVKIPNFVGKFVNAYGDGILLGNCTLDLNASLSHCRIGAQLGTSNSNTGAGIKNSNIVVNITDIARFGVLTGLISNTTISGRVSAPKTAYYNNRFAVLGLGDGSHDTQANVTYSVTAIYDANWTNVYRNDPSSPITFTNCKIVGADLTGGYTTYAKMCQMAIPLYDCPGYTSTTLGQPSEGPHVLGQYLRNANPATGSAKGWYCTVSGTPGTWVSEGNL